ncbi:MAG: Dabb family protein [Bacteroidota bacterium]
MIRKTVFVIFGLCVLACNTNKTKSVEEMTASEKEVFQETQEYGDYVHSVYVWLKNPNNDADREAFETEMKQFIHDLPYAKLFHFGKVVPSLRPVVESSYHYSFIVAFTSEEKMKQYDTDPAHKTFLANTKNLIDSIRVYDSRNLME